MGDGPPVEVTLADEAAGVEEQADQGGGQGPQQNLEQALKWYRAAADRDHAAAQNMLGTLYLTGNGVERSPEKAEHWWRKAAEQGYAPAQYNLGGMYSRHLSKALTREEALEWLSRAAGQGHAKAETELAELDSATSASTPAL